MIVLDTYQIGYYTQSVDIRLPIADYVFFFYHKYTTRNQKKKNLCIEST
jgi:hypothetical protein